MKSVTIKFTFLTEARYWKCEVTINRRFKASEISSQTYLKGVGQHIAVYNLLRELFESLGYSVKVIWDEI